MEILLEKRDLRLLKLLEILYREQKWHRVESLALEIDCSEDSIYKDILYLKDTIGETDFELINQTGKGIFLETISGVSLGKIQSQYIKNTFMYQVILKILAGEQMDAQNLMAEYYLSQSTFYRKIKRIKLFLETNDLVLDTINFTLEGSEIMIRELYYFFSWQTVRDETWPFPEAPQKILAHRLNQIIQEFDFKLTEVEKLQLLHRMAVNFTRTQKRNYMKTEMNVPQSDPFRRAYFEPIAQKLNQAIPSGNQVAENNYCQLIFSTYIYAHTDMNLDVTQIVTWHKRNKTPSYLFICHLFDLLEQEFETETIKTVKNEPFLFYSLLTISNYFLLFPYLKLPKELRKNWQNQLAYYKHENNLFCSTIATAVDLLVELKQLDKDRINKDYCIYTIYGIVNQTVEIASLKKPLKIKIVCEADPLSESFFGRQLLAKSSFPIEIYTAKEEQHLDFLYDLTVSDLKIKQLNTLNEYIWNFPPTERDWENILLIIETLGTQKAISLED